MIEYIYGVLGITPWLILIYCCIKTNRDKTDKCTMQYSEADPSEYTRLGVSVAPKYSGFPGRYSRSL